MEPRSVEETIPQPARGATGFVCAPASARRNGALAKRPVRSILIILTKPFGDQIIASALIRNLRSHYPGVRIAMLGTKAHASFLLQHGIADEVFFSDNTRRARTLIEKLFPARAADFITMLRRIRQAHFDMTIDLTDRKTSRFYCGLINAPIRVGYNPPERPLRRFERQPANYLAPPFGYGGEHYLHRYLAPLEALQLPLIQQWPAIDPLPDEVTRARALLRRHGIEHGKFIVTHLGSSYLGRSWQPNRFATVMSTIAAEANLPFVLIGGREEVFLADAVKAQANCRIVDLTGALKLETLLAVLKDAHIFFGNDSGPMHMAAAVGTPVVALFGMTEPARWGPVGVPHATVRAPMPCACINRTLCQFPDTTKACCIWRIPVDEVVQAIRGLLARVEKNDAKSLAQQDEKLSA